MEPYNVKTTKNDLIRRLAIRNYGDKDAQKYIDELKTRDWSHTFDENGNLRNKITEPTKEEIKAARVLDFTHYINYNEPREKRWTNKK